MASRGDVVAAALAISCIMYRHWVQYLCSAEWSENRKALEATRATMRNAQLRFFNSGSLTNVASKVHIF